MMALHRETLRDILDGDSFFQWKTDGLQQMVFSLCSVFLLDKEFCFSPIFCQLLHLTATISISQSIMHALKGKTVYILQAMTL